MAPACPRPLVHVELHTGDLEAARAFYEELCGWRSQRVESSCGSYLALELGRKLSGGVVECATAQALWLPYVEVADVAASTDHARLLGGKVLLAPREGPAGWRSVVAVPDGSEVALWQPKG